MTPYIHFKGTCREAMTAYQALFGGRLDLMDYGQMPGASEVQKASGRIMHAALMSEEVGDLQASDFPTGFDGDDQKGVSISIQLDSAERTKEVFETLAVGGAEIHPLMPTFFSPAFGMVKDRFGTHWILSTTPSA